jgi:hypothetical protein
MSTNIAMELHNGDIWFQVNHIAFEDEQIELNTPIEFSAWYVAHRLQNEGGSGATSIPELLQYYLDLMLQNIHDLKYGSQSQHWIVIRNHYLRFGIRKEDL